jgi:hypothetical protein
MKGGGVEIAGSDEEEGARKTGKDGYGGWGNRAESMLIDSVRVQMMMPNRTRTRRIRAQGRDLKRRKNSGRSQWGKKQAERCYEQAEKTKE